MFDLQDVSQLDSSVDVDSSDTALESAQQGVGSDPATGSGQDPVNTKPAKMIDAERYNKLMSAHQKALSDNRQARGEWERYNQERTDLLARLERLEGGLNKSATKPAVPGEPDFSQMSQKEIVDFLTSSAEERAFQRLQSETKKQSEAQEQAQMQKQKEAEQTWYQSKWDKVLTEHPDADAEAIESFMSEERIFNPERAYELMNKETLTQKEIAKAQKETVKKISSNQRNFTEGSGKAGMETPKKPSLGTKKDRKEYISQRMTEIIQGQS
mgnify:CR=1 FL=1